MRHIEIKTWARREQYRLYRNFDQPHFNMCANVDVTTLHSSLKQFGATFTAGVLYVLTRAANDIPAFRDRMRGDSVVEHEIVHPGTAVVSDDDLLGFCSLVYTPDFATFASAANNVMSMARKSPSLRGNQGGTMCYSPRAFRGSLLPALHTRCIFTQPTAYHGSRGGNASTKAAA